MAYPSEKWDKALAHFACRHGAKLTVDCSMVHSGALYGANLFWGTLAKMVEGWAKEAQFFRMN